MRLWYSILVLISFSFVLFFPRFILHSETYSILVFNTAPS